MKHSKFLWTTFAFGHLAANVRVRCSEFSKLRVYAVYSNRRPPSLFGEHCEILRWQTFRKTLKRWWGRLEKRWRQSPAGTRPAMRRRRRLMTRRRREFREFNSLQVCFLHFFFISNTYLVTGMKAREGSRCFPGSKNKSTPGGRLAKIKSAPSSSMLKIKSAPTGVWQKITWRPKG